MGKMGRVVRVVMVDSILGSELLIDLVEFINCDECDAYEGDAIKSIIGTSNAGVSIKNDNSGILAKSRNPPSKDVSTRQITCHP